MALGGFWVRAVVDQLRSVEKRGGWDRERFVRFSCWLGGAFWVGGGDMEAISKAWLFGWLFGWLFSDLTVD